MTPIETLSEIHNHQIKGVMLHDELANLYDFLGLCGYKACHEYHAIEEFINARKTARYAINHINKMLTDGNPSITKITPANWKQATRYDLTESDRKGMIKELFKRWKTWEQETKSVYQTKFKDLMAQGEVACANYVNELIKDVDKELKKLEREYLRLISVGYDMPYIDDRQTEIYEKYIAMELSIE